MDIIRYEAENCDDLGGFQLCHSIGGGTGSGLGTALLLKIRDNYSDKISQSFTVFPSPKVSDVAVEPYNAILSIVKLIENCDQTFVIDNQAVYNMAQRIFGKNKDNDKEEYSPKYSDLNWLIHLTMLNVTESFRFTFDENQGPTLRRLCMNMVPFPRLHFLMTSYAPLYAPGTPPRHPSRFLDTYGLRRDIWHQRNYFAAIDGWDGKHLAVFAPFTNAQIVEWWDCTAYDLNREDCVEWIPYNWRTSLCMIPKMEGMAAGLIANTTMIKQIFQRISDQFDNIFKKRAFLNGYIDDGMEEMEFIEADKNVLDLIEEYQDKQDAVVCCDNENESGEDEEEYFDGGHISEEDF